jgi:dCMP deaminase
MISVLQKLTDLPVRELSLGTVATIEAKTIVTPREDIGRVIVEKYFSDKEVEYRTVFLRRNKDNVGETKEPQVPAISLDEFQTNVWQAVLTEAAKSTDWWRQVGAALVKNSEVLFVRHNEHMPEEQLPNIEGDARSLFKKGINVNYVTAAHAEATVIAEAAKRGISTDGAEVYVTDFPCPYCARMLVKAGIKKIYFKEGYAVLDGDDFLEGEGVEVIRLK